MTRRVVPLLLGLGLGMGPLPADVVLPPVLGSHMVLQRGMPVPIWGKASPGEKVTVTFRGQEKSAEAGADGKWIVRLDPLDPGDPAAMTVAGANTLTLDDVLVGEVWVGSGQSNMDTDVRTYVTSTIPAGTTPDPAAKESPYDAANKAHVRDEALAKLAQGTYPGIRLISSHDAKGWQEANPQTLPAFSALLFCYGQRLQQELGVPVGLVFGAVGATSSEQWISRPAYEADEACKEALAKFSATYSFDEAQKKYDATLAAWKAKVGPEAAAAAAAEAPPAGGVPPPERPAWAGPAPDTLPPRPLGPFRPGDVTRDLRLPNKNIGDLYEIHIRPFIPYAIRGVLWDQGEGGSGIFGLDQYTLMGALFRGWRSDWGQGDFPFLYVQKPSGGGRAWDPADPETPFASPPAPLPPAVPNDGVERSAYIRIATYPHAFMVPASDLGSGTHPVNKSGYGARAARVALGAVYGKPVEICGPLLASFRVEDGKVRVSFLHVGKGLAIPAGEPLQGFAVAGSDRAFHWADASIDGNDVVLSCGAVASPVAIRYAWSRTHPWANLFNADGLPALAFRTDDWP